MARRGKVVWSEGMALDPQHLQQWERNQAAVVQARVKSVAPLAWGLTELDFDQDAIAIGTFRIIRCSGVFGDGLVFSVPDSDPPPSARSVEGQFAPTADRLSVYLATPAERADGVNVLLPTDTTKREVRYAVTSRLVVDETTGQEPRAIEVAHPNLMLRFSSEQLESYTTLRIAQLRRTTAGEFVHDERFVPPCLAIGASLALRAITRRILALLTATSDGLWNRTRSLPRGQAGLSAADVASLCLQQIVNAYLPVFSHYAASWRHHPDTLYTTLVMLAGQLSALPHHTEPHPRTYPLYDHDDASRAFEMLEATIARMLGGEIEVNYVVIPLVRHEDLLIGEVADATLLEEATFYLVGRGIADGAERAIPDQLRVASPNSIRALMRTFLPALPLELERRPPIGTPTGEDLHYYRLARDGQFWNDIRASRALAIQVPTTLNGLSLQLIAVRQGN